MKQTIIYSTVLQYNTVQYSTHASIYIYIVYNVYTVLKDVQDAPTIIYK